jgi:DNA replication protein DnaC
VLASLEARQRQAIEGQGADVECLERVREAAVEHRAQKPLALRVRRAALNTTKTLEGFDGRVTPPSTASRCSTWPAVRTIRPTRHVWICGPTGVGNSHLAQALAHEARRQGFAVLFVNTYTMLQHLHGGRADGTWMKRLSGYLRPELLVLDDFGLKPLVDPAPSDLDDVRKWLRVLGRAETSHIDQDVGHQLHPVVPLLDVLEPEQ